MLYGLFGIVVMMKLEVGDMAPTFEASDQHEDLHDLEDYEGQWLLLYFYPQDDTSGCTTEACSFRDNMGVLKEKVVVLGVSPDTLDSHKNFSSKYNLNFPILADPERTILTAYGVGTDFGKRTSFLISPEGMIQKIYENVVPENHVAEVLDDLIQVQGFEE